MWTPRRPVPGHAFRVTHLLLQVQGEADRVAALLRPSKDHEDSLDQIHDPELRNSCVGVESRLLRSYSTKESKPSMTGSVFVCGVS